jgi:lipid biosynthesis B12-binding/radical SAM protein
MKILLISSNTSSSPYPVYPLGCSVIAAVLSDAGHDVKIFDFLAEQETYDSLECEIRNFNPDIAGISIRNIDNVNILEEQSFLAVPKKITSLLHRLVPSIPVILGGSGFSIMPEEILKFTRADYGVAGEGETAIIELVQKLAAGEKPAEKIFKSSRLLDGVGIYGATYFSHLTEFYKGTGSIMPLQTKRGCVNNCLYCTYPFLEGRELRCRKPEDVVGEMQRLRDEYDVDCIFFTDSVFNDSQGEYLQVIKAIEKSGLDIPWTAFFQPDPKLDKDTVKRMIDAGLHSVELGPDAASDTTLKGIGKKFNFNDVIRCNELFASEQIAVANYFMMGGPKETEQTAKEGVENIRSLDMSVSFVFLGIRILPGTPIYKISLDEGIIDNNTDILNPVYYFSPDLNRQWLEDYLDSTLSKIKHCVYPPNSMDTGIQILRKMGYQGNLWEMMVKDSKRLKKIE